MEKTSEFGSGFIYPLVLFAQHFNNESFHAVMNHAYYGKMTDAERKNTHMPTETKVWLDKIVPIYGGIEQALSHDIELWANGASDHLYQFAPPAESVEDEDGLFKLSCELRDTALAMGHGFTGKTWTVDDLKKLMTLTHSIARLVDANMGVATIEAEFK